MADPKEVLEYLDRGNTPGRPGWKCTECGNNSTYVRCHIDYPKEEVCARCAISGYWKLRSQLSALREHLGELAGFKNRTAELHDVGKMGAAVWKWLNKAREILGGE